MEPPAFRAFGEKITTLWADAGIQKAYAERHTFQLNDSARYYFARMDAVAAPGYVPTKQDLLRSRVRTTGHVCVYPVATTYTISLFVCTTGVRLRCDRLSFLTIAPVLCFVSPPGSWRSTF